jgi:hypothetical protein
VKGGHAVSFAELGDAFTHLVHDAAYVVALVEGW